MLIFNTDSQNLSSIGEEAGKLESRTFFDVTLTAFGTMETLTVPAQTCTSVYELRQALAKYLGYIEPAELTFFTRSGSFSKKLADTDKVVRKIMVKGIKDFKIVRHRYEHPYGIIGAGYLGIKCAMYCAQHGYDDFVMFDRYPRVGGHAWLEMANKTTRLQTEFPTFHVWYGMEYSYPGNPKCGGAPIKGEIWPKQTQIAEHFQRAVDDYGIQSHLYLSTSVESMEIQGEVSVSNHDRYYQLYCAPSCTRLKDEQGIAPLSHQHGGSSENVYVATESEKEPFFCKVSCIAMWPGCLVFPRIVEYPNEEDFGAPCDYAVEMRYDYRHTTGKIVCIHGHGAFTMENIRTCAEFGCKHCYVLCRKRNLTMPRMVSWFINQSNPPVSGPQTLNMLQHGYKLVNYDPWDMHSVTTNNSHSFANIYQKTRFGIGDLYFLAIGYGLAEIVIGEVKRCSYKTLHLMDGGKLEVDCVLKCTGCLGDWKVDRLLRIKEMAAFFVNCDPRRVCQGEADGIDASSFAYTTAGPGNYSFVKQVFHFWECPNDWRRLHDEGILKSLPRHVAGEPDPEYPAYFYMAGHAKQSGLMLGSACPLLSHRGAFDEDYKHWIQNLCAPLDYVHAEAKKDWEYYEARLREQGQIAQDAPYIPYPYSIDYMNEQFGIYNEEVMRKQGIDIEAHHADMAKKFAALPELPPIR